MHSQLADSSKNKWYQFLLVGDIEMQLQLLNRQNAHQYGAKYWSFFCCFLQKTIVLTDFTVTGFHKSFKKLKIACLSSYPYLMNSSALKCKTSYQITNRFQQGSSEVLFASFRGECDSSCLR